MPQVSIIVPVYNAEDRISAAIDGVLTQTYSDWELILVDDGSRDRSFSIISHFAERDARIRVVHKENGGVSSARNAGLEVATGKYVTFLDADDYWMTDYLEKMIGAAHDVDLVICGFQTESGDFIPPSETVELTMQHAEVEKFITNPYYLDAPWCKFFCRNILEDCNIRFDQKLRLTEDTIFCYEYFSHCRNIAVVGVPLLVYSGVWGGTSKKYALEKDEVLYISQRCVDVIKAINNSMGLSVDYRRKGWHISKLKGLFENYTDQDVYNMYVSVYGEVDKAKFLGDSNVSPLAVAYISLLQVKQDAKSKQFLLTNIRHFLTTPPSRIAFDSIKRKCLYYMLRCLPISVLQYII